MRSAVAGPWHHPLSSLCCWSLPPEHPAVLYSVVMAVLPWAHKNSTLSGEACCWAPSALLHMTCNYHTMLVHVQCACAVWRASFKTWFMLFTLIPFIWHYLVLFCCNELSLLIIRLIKRLHRTESETDEWWKGKHFEEGGHCLLKGTLLAMVLRKWFKIINSRVKHVTAALSAQFLPREWWGQRDMLRKHNERDIHRSDTS
jgi:hypothetical protein